MDDRLLDEKSIIQLCFVTEDLNKTADWLSELVSWLSAVRWSLVSPRLNGFRANPFARHPGGELIRPTP